MKTALAAVLLGLACAAGAQPLVLPRQPQTEFVQHLGARLPLDARLRDETDRAVTLGDYFGPTPAIVVFGYYRCPNLCESELQSVVQTLRALPLDRASYSVVGIGIDPRETAADARRRKAHYEGSSLHLLRGDEATVSRLARIAGFEYAYDAALDQYAHPAGFLVGGADGRITRYFMGVAHSARDLRLALVEASEGRIGSPADRLLLLCSHYDPSSGRYNVAVMSGVRAGSLGVLALLGGWLWRQRRARRRA